MKLAGSKILVIGGAGFIGSGIFTLLMKIEVAEVVVYDNFAHGILGNTSSFPHECTPVTCDGCRGAGRRRFNDAAVTIATEANEDSAETFTWKNGGGLLGAYIELWISDFRRLSGLEE